MTRFTKREREILDYMSDNIEAENAELARKLCISIRTVRTHLHNMRIKTNVHSTRALIVGWLQHRWGKAQ